MGVMPWDSVATLATDVIDKIFPDKADADQAKAALISAQQKGDLQQIEAIWNNAAQQLEVNKVEAASDHLIEYGWRPFIGWVCGFAFMWNFIGEPMAAFVAVTLGSTADLPQMDLTQMMPVLLGMLGLGGYRTYEKFKGVSKKAPGA